MVTGTQLAKHGYEGIADQRVDFVDQHDDRFWRHFGPANERLPQGTGTEGGEDVGPDAVEELVAGGTGTRGEASEHLSHTPRHVFAHRLGGFDIDIDAMNVAAVVEPVPQGEERGGLAGLPRSVQDEIPFVPDKAEDVVDVQPLQRLDAVVLLAADRAFGIESAHAAQCDTPRMSASRYTTASNSSKSGWPRYVPFGALRWACALRKWSDWVQASKAARDAQIVCDA